MQRNAWWGTICNFSFAPLPTQSNGGVKMACHWMHSQISFSPAHIVISASFICLCFTAECKLQAVMTMQGQWSQCSMLMLLNSQAWFGWVDSSLLNWEHCKVVWAQKSSGAGASRGLSHEREFVDWNCAESWVWLPKTSMSSFRIAHLIAAWGSEGTHVHC